MAQQDASKRTPDDIRQEIQATRQRMDSTLNAIEDRINPDRLKSEASATIREQTMGRVERLRDNAAESMKGVSADVFETIKKNPLPAALAAIGLGWLFMESRNQNRGPQMRYPEQYRYNRYNPDEYRYYDTNDWNTRGQAQRGPADRARATAGQLQGNVQQMAGQVQDKAQQAAGQVQDKAQQAAGQVQDTAQQVAGQVQDKAQQFANQAQGQVQQFSDMAQQQAYQVRSRFADLMDENPLLVGAAAVAIGAAVGLSLPATAKEDELIGSVRDDVMQQAQSKAQDTMQKVQQVASKAGDAAKQEAQRQNLSPS